MKRNTVILLSVGLVVVLLSLVIIPKVVNFAKDSHLDQKERRAAAEAEWKQCEKDTLAGKQWMGNYPPCTKRRCFRYHEGSGQCLAWRFYFPDGSYNVEGL